MQTDGGRLDDLSCRKGVRLDARPRQDPDETLFRAKKIFDHRGFRIEQLRLNFRRRKRFRIARQRQFRIGDGDLVLRRAQLGRQFFDLSRDHASLFRGCFVALALAAFDCIAKQLLAFQQRTAGRVLRSGQRFLDGVQRQARPRPFAGREGAEIVMHIREQFDVELVMSPRTGE